MLPELSPSLETSHDTKMLAIIKQWQEGFPCQTINTDKYLFLILLKLVLDTVAFCLCCRKFYTSFLSMCSLSIVIADAVMAFGVAAMWFEGAERSLASLCFLLANASAIYGALPLPMMCLGLLDYGLGNTLNVNQTDICKHLRNVVLTLLVWIQAFIYAFSSVKAELIELDYVMGIKALVCAVEESAMINYFVLVLFSILIFSILPFWSRIPQWVKEADRLHEVREEQENHRSDILFISTTYSETQSGGDIYLYESIKPRPPLWFSLTLGFGIFWMPYLIVTVACLTYGFGVPAYVTVNLLWLECTNSLLLGVIFWIKSKTLGPYINQPENVCLWHVYWHLSKGTQEQQLHIAESNPAKEKRNAVFYV
ncbi:probable G-protein coupled receptor 160 [Anabas testudineus]|uniref:probable G-protein coupled receptor 160 n=1 Tax=Anabas testudineus TaxID=64144 RepID=UPI000E45F947|nr:probable G-protein coupled receptor 160 [Anabas testudineus]XP_026224469.1 probable G-protein coupled receptor 160 [Anabas testudineus]